MLKHIAFDGDILQLGNNLLFLYSLSYTGLTHYMCFSFFYICIPLCYLKNLHLWSITAISCCRAALVNAVLVVPVFTQQGEVFSLEIPNVLLQASQSYIPNQRLKMWKCVFCLYVFQVILI